MSEAEFITLKNDKGLEVTISSCGASIYRIRYKDKDMILTPKDKEVFYKNTKFYGLTIGRIAGRMKNGLLEVNGKKYQLEQNERTNSLHGGFHSIAFKNWEVGRNETDRSYDVIFKTITIDGEGGYNGNCSYEVIYSLKKEENALEVLYRAKCDEDTYINLTNHAYFNLGYEKDMLNHELQLNSDTVSTFDEDFVINGYVNVNDVHDFRSFKKVGKHIDDPSLHEGFLRGYDHRYHLIDPEHEPIILRNKGIEMDVYTDFDAVHVYTSGFPVNYTLIDGSLDAAFRGITLECENTYPEKVEANQLYQHYVKYYFK